MFRYYIILFIIFVILGSCTCTGQVNNLESCIPVNNIVDNSPSNGFIGYGFYLIDENQFAGATKAFELHIKSYSSTSSSVIIYEYYRIAYYLNARLLYEASIYYCNEALKIKTDNLNNYLEVLMLLAENHLEIKNTELAQKYLDKAKQVSISPEDLVKTCVFQGELFRHSGKTNVAIKQLQTAISNINKGSNGEPLATIYNNLGLMFLDIGEYDSSLFYLNKSHFIIDSLDIFYRKDAIGVSFGLYHQKTGNYKESIKYFKNTLKKDLNYHPNKAFIIRDSYEGLSKSFYLNKEYKSAYETQIKLNEIKEVITNYNGLAATFDNRINAETEIYKSKLKAFKEKVRIEKEYNDIKMSVLLSLTLVFLLIMYVLILRNKNNKQRAKLEGNAMSIKEYELEQVKLKNIKLKFELKENESESKLRKLEKKSLEDRLDYSRRELTSSMVHVLNKSEVLSQIEQILAGFQQEKSSNQNLINSISTLIKDNLRFDTEWNNFKKHFEEVHPAFFKTLADLYPSLTNEESKLCAYMKMGMSSKEIAQMLNITSAAVNKRRNRLRKKFSIHQEIDLYKFLMNLRK